jgi:transcriptional regulator with XRE-family HTH domain
MARRFSPEKVRQLIAERETSVRAVAKRMNPEVFEQERASINKWLSGKHSPNAESARKLAAAIPAEVDELYEDEDDVDSVLPAVAADVDEIAARQIA